MVEGGENRDKGRKRNIDRGGVQKKGGEVQYESRIGLREGEGERHRNKQECRERERERVTVSSGV